MRWIYIRIIEYLILFNKNFNRKRAIGKEIQTVTIILAQNHYHLNTIFKDYKIKNMTPENDLKIERYIAAHKIQDL